MWTRSSQVCLVKVTAAPRCWNFGARVAISSSGSTLEATGDIRQVGLWLGHASIQTTEMYLRVDPVDKLEILSGRQPPEIQKGNFKGVQDQLLAMLAA